ncbi:(2Fe-2S)-binding protein [Dokdonella sp.]|uniref:(2Fe-2S)-binding protein n=1 Tax=Dokdonella sp. TaxID=2291710 RepID=UPI0025C0D92E|nr:(2Fe-2S)-binding protein [Dokdonella sp.]
MQDLPEPRTEAPDTSARALPAGTLQLSINGKPFYYRGDTAMPLVWYLRDTLRLTGTKYACENGCSGACMVLADGKPARSCQLTMLNAAGHAITTIEGLDRDGLHPVQRAWLEHDVIQCGYCQAGQIMAAVALLERTSKPSDADIAAIGNLCRCGTQPRIRAAIRRAAELAGERAP